MPDLVTLSDGETDEPDEGDERDLAAVTGWRMEYNDKTHECGSGQHWCNEELGVFPVDPGMNPYDKAVLRTMNGVARLNAAGATLMLRLGRGFRRRMVVGRVIVDGDARTVALHKPR